MIQFAQVDRAVIERAALEYAVNALWQLPLLAAATWLVTARHKFAEQEDEGGVAHVTRLLDTLRARAE